jgi:hypothetical protein
MTASITTLPAGLAVACRIQSQEGNTLKITASSAFGLRTPVKVEDAGNLWMGEVWVSEPEGSGFHIEIELSQVLRDTAEIERMASKFRQTPQGQPIEGIEETPQQLA